jgi:hypothetical protein
MRRVQLLNSNPHNDMAGYTLPAGAFHYVQVNASHHPQSAHETESSNENYAHTPGSTAADLAFSPWLLNMSPYTSPLSRTSSLSSSEYISTPPAYTEPSPMYHLMDQTQPHPASYMAHDSQYVINQEFIWQAHLAGSTGGGSQQPLPPRSTWQQSEYVTTSLPPNMEYYAPLYADNAAASFPQSRPSHHGRLQSSDEDATLKTLDVDNGTVSSDGDSDSDDFDSDDSSSSRSASHSNLRSHQKSSTVAPVLCLGRMSMVPNPYNHPPQRHYVCPMLGKAGHVGRDCKQRFARPEHLRRHVLTVHGEDRPHVCKVGSCEKAFSRSDNLRDHYWTHLERGGRVGKNNKMSLAELKEILGPKEKKLVKKLKKKLTNEYCKQRSRPLQQVRQKSKL